MSQEQRRIALVSDGARGIGAATVRKLAADGWDVSFCYREDALAARRVEKAASELGARVTAIQADICDPAEVSSWFDRTHDELGPVTAVVSCAGITRDQPLTMLTDQDWRAVTDAGLDGTFQLCRAATAAMLKRRTGRIVAVSSVCGAYDNCAQGHDISSRPGLAAFIRALVSEEKYDTSEEDREQAIATVERGTLSPMILSSTNRMDTIRSWAKKEPIFPSANVSDSRLRGPF